MMVVSSRPRLTNEATRLPDQPVDTEEVFDPRWLLCRLLFCKKLQSTGRSTCTHARTHLLIAFMMPTIGGRGDNPEELHTKPEPQAKPEL